MLASWMLTQPFPLWSVVCPASLHTWPFFLLHSPGCLVKGKLCWRCEDSWSRGAGRPRHNPEWATVMETSLFPGSWALATIGDFMLAFSLLRPFWAQTLSPINPQRPPTMVPLLLILDAPNSFLQKIIHLLSVSQAGIEAHFSYYLKDNKEVLLNKRVVYLWSPSLGM